MKKKRKPLRRAATILIAAAFSYLAITTAADIALMGLPRFKRAQFAPPPEYFVEKPNRIDMQKGDTCAGYASAYVMRHFGVEITGEEAFAAMPNRSHLQGGTYPKGIRNLFRNNGFNAEYCTGSFAALKAELCKGAPVIVMIRTYPGAKSFHFVPIVGYDEQRVYFAESLEEFTESGARAGNSWVENAEFLRLWNIAELKQPLYRNTFFSIEPKEPKAAD